MQVEKPGSCAASSASAASRRPAPRGVAHRAALAQPVADCAAAHQLLTMTPAIVPPTSLIVTTCGCVRGLRRAPLALEERRARSSSDRCDASTLTATERCRSWSSASQTPAIPPFAMWRTTR